ncbi:MAG: LysM peptidoglycan-binding domain-containing protein [Chloroflexota bacterium]
MSQKRLFSIISLLLMVTLVLAACERPLPGSGGDDPDTGQPAETTEQTTESTDTTDTDSTNEATTDTDGGEATTADTDGDAAEGTAGGDAAEGAADGDAGESEGESSETTPREEEAAAEAEDAYPSSEETNDGTATEATEETAEGSTEMADEAGDPGEENSVGEEESGEEAADSGAADSGDEGESQEEAAAEQGDEASSEEADSSGTEAAESGGGAPEAEEAAEAGTNPGTHTVASGENLYRIGLQYGISWVALAQHNNLSNANQIVEGQVLKIPGGEGEEPEPAPTPSPQTEVVYTVQPGDNLYRIGVANNISWTQIAEANGIVNPNQIVAGQQLKIPVDKPGSGQQSFMHTVQSGETLFLISLRYGVAWPAVAEANELESPYVIFPGQTLEIPGK